MRAQVGDLVSQRLGRRRPPGRVRLKRVDLVAKLGDLATLVGVGGLEVLDAAHQGLVAGKLVGGSQQLGSDLVGQDEAGGERDQGDRQDAEPAGGHG